MSSLRHELEVSNHRGDTCKAAYDLLVDTIKQEGSMLRAKDRENYAKALRDLRDYAIYKEVIEAAMVRLQSELDAVMVENRSLREESEKNMRGMRQKLSTSQRYDHYATTVYKKSAEAEARIHSLEQEVSGDIHVCKARLCTMHRICACTDDVQPFTFVLQMHPLCTV